MKKKTERKLAQGLFAACMLLAGAAYILGYVKYTFHVAGVNVAIYPAAFLALVGVVQLFGTYLPSNKQQ